MKSKIINCFNKNADTYDLVGEVQVKVANSLAARIASQSFHRILEIGCGTGFLSQHLLTKFPSANIILSDIAPRMIEKIKKKFSETNVCAICEDAETYVSEHAYDLIASSMTFQWFIEHTNSLNNIYHNLAQQGHLNFAMLGENSLKEWREIIDLKKIQLPEMHFIPLTQIKKLFPTIRLEKEVIVQEYDSLNHFLFSLKKLGATAVKENYIPTTAGKMRALLQEFSSPLKMSYEIIYGHYVKS